jgi:hypothetical protein
MQLQTTIYIARLMTDAELSYTWERTNEINMLLVRRTLMINAIIDSGISLQVSEKRLKSF